MMTTDSAPSGHRLQKILAQAGYGSRREIETWISQGQIVINGKPATLGDRVRPFDKIKLNGQLIPAERLLYKERRLIIYHKPVGQVTTRNDPEGRPTVFDQLPRLRGGRWVAVGRLDINTSGLLLFTTDGQLANTLMHPRHEIEREYAVRVLGEVTPEMIRRLKEGVMLDDTLAKAQDVKVGGGEGANRWYNIVLKEGRNREIRRLWESLGVKVNRLIRVRFDSITLPRDLRAGSHLELTEQQMASLVKLTPLDERADKPAANDPPSAAKRGHGRRAVHKNPKQKPRRPAKGR